MVLIKVTNNYTVHIKNDCGLVESNNINLTWAWCYSSLASYSYSFLIRIMDYVECGAVPQCLYNGYKQFLKLLCYRVIFGGKEGTA